MTILSRRNLSIAAAVLATAALTAGALIASTAEASVETGAKAPAFSIADTKGKTRTLSEFAGKTVVLEWTNDQCPYVQKHYSGGAMQGLQKAAAADGVVWLSVISSAPGKQGYVAPARADELTSTRGAAPEAVLLDPKGEVGRAYGAKTTPHLYVIDAKGVLVYQGGIDDKNSTRPADIAGAKNYVKLALADVKAGRPVAVPFSQPYGCSIKYAD